MNPILNKLYFFYKSQEELLDRNISTIASSEDEYKHRISATHNIVAGLRDALAHKKYNEAKRLIEKLTIDATIITELDNLVAQLESNDLAYDTSIGLEPNHYQLILDKIRSLGEAHNSTDGFEALQNKLDAIIKLFDNINNANATNNTQELISTLNELILKTKSNNSETIPQETIDTLCKYCSQLSSENENFITITSKIMSLAPQINEIDSVIKNHLNTVKTDFTLIVTSFKEQVLSSVESIKQSTIETASVINSTLPTKVNMMIEDIPKKVDNAINKSIRINFALFAVILFLVTITSVYFMGRIAGSTTSNQIINYINSKVSKPSPDATLSDKNHGHPKK